MSLPTVQFPLCGLAYGDGDAKIRVLHCMAHGIVTAGRMLLAKHSHDEADALIADAPKCDAPKSFSREHLRIVQLGRAFTGIYFSYAPWPWTAAESLEAFLVRWKAAGRTAPITRIPSPIANEVAWQHADYKVFAALCALNTAIGSKPYAIVTRSRIRAGMLGYSSGKLLFDENGELSDAGRTLLSSREDGITSAPSDNQVRTLLDKLVARGLAQRFHPFNGSFSYFSKFLGPEEIAARLITRAERTTHNRKLIAMGQRLRAVKNGTPLSGEHPLSGEQPPHNGEAPHNEETTAQAPPDHRPGTAQAPLNASVLMLPVNASKQMSGALVVSDSEKKPEPAAPEMTPPTLSDVQTFFASLRKGGDDLAAKWLMCSGSDSQWLTKDWKRAATRWLLDPRRHKRNAAIAP